MARSSLKVAASSLLVSSILFVGCGSSEPNVFEEEEPLSDPTHSGGSSGGASGFGDSDPGAQGEDEGSSSGGGGAGDVGNVDADSVCKTASEEAELAPINLVLMIDRSGSMGGSVRNVRWDPVVAGLKSFFADPSSHNFSASLAFFPAGSSSTCAPTATYANPLVPLTQLPNAAAFSTALDDTSPTGSNTPTKPALDGAIDTAKAIQATGKHVAVILATDGAPNGCSSTKASVDQSAAAGLAAGIKTYVLGVGPSTGNLDSFAQNGGTTKAIMIPTTNPTQVSDDLRAAIGQIAASLLGCSFALPPPPAGEALDYNAVNVNFTPQGGTATTLAYSADCSDKNGWRYDNLTAPTEIVLCADMCDTVKSELGAKVEILFGCATKVPPGGKGPGVK